MNELKVIPVKVVLRCRPMSPREGADGCQMCLQFVRGEPQVILGTNKAFTYDYIFPPDSTQEEVYNDAVSHLVKGVFKGYNATVLAYGQTGSGKTHSMGGGWGAHSGTEDEVGVIPRVIKELFDGINSEKESFGFVVRVSYLELYKETLIDLLTPRAEQDTEGVIIREDPNGGIKLTGLLVREVSDEEDLLTLLAKGALSRTTGATAMNSVSSRSHAIFTIHVERTNKHDSNDFIKAKFHLVDLAGSERAKKTHAQGDRFKEGVNINLGLLALGNVISALGDESQKRTHIPYRDSKLTRLLQDSLGGNSLTVMIACVSPADSNMEETLSTMRYADRARKIKNKPIVNRDPQAAEILRLKQLYFVKSIKRFLPSGIHIAKFLQVQSLQSGGATISSSNSNNGYNNNGNSEDTKKLREKITSLMEENLRLSRELHNSVDQSTHMCERLIVAETTRDSLKEKLERLREKTGLSITMMLNKTEREEERAGEKSQAEHVSLLQELCDEMEDIGKQNDVVLSDILEEELQHSAATTPGGSSDTPHSPEGTPDSALQDHALRQAKLSRELQGLNEMLEKKEKLASQMLQNDDQMNTMREQYEKTMKELESEVHHLHKEKDELVSALNVTKSNPALSKVSEQRRKRLQELGGQITELKRKILEQGKMLKVKEISVKHCEKLNQEIQAMKRQRVKLMNQMKDDSDNFRRWKLTKEKEVAQLKAKDRKRQVEMTKLELRHERQQVVMRRKAEEATLANKRLKDALALQRLAADERRDRLAKKDMSGIGARIRKWLSQELEVLVSIAEAKRHLQEVISDRKELNKQLRDCESKLSLDPPSKKSLLNDSSTHDADASHQELRDEMTRLEQEVELRSVQISELQQKLMDADQEEKAKSRWDNVHTMVEAKCGLKWLLSVAVEAKMDFSLKLSELERVRDAYREAVDQGEEVNASISDMRRTHDNEVTCLRQDYEKKVLFLLKQLKTCDLAPGASANDPELKERLQFQEVEIERLGVLQERLEQKTSECDTLKKELTVAAYTGDIVKTPLMPRVDLPEQWETETPVSMEEEESDADNSIWDNVNDPDYVQTPLFKHRHVKLTKRSVAAPPTDSVACGCQGKCKTKQCRCRKAGQHCGFTCRCTDTQCLNREPQEPVSTTSEEQMMDSTFCISSRDDSGASAGETSSNPLLPSKPIRTAWDKRSGNFALPLSIASEGSSGEKGDLGKGRKRRLGQVFNDFLE